MASRKEEKEQRRQERLARERAEESKAGRRKTIAYIVGGAIGMVAIVAVVVAVVSSGGGDKNGSNKGGAAKSNIAPLKPPAPKIADFDTAVAAAHCSYKKFPNEGRQHLPPDSKLPKYKTNPPTSGNHYPTPASDGAYVEAPNNGGLLHSLEHGRVQIQYQKNLSLKQQQQLRGLFDEDSERVQLFPNATQMPYQVAAAAWTRLLTCKQMNAATFDAIRAFIKKYRDQGPELILQPE